MFTRVSVSKEVPSPAEVEAFKTADSTGTNEVKKADTEHNIDLSKLSKADLDGKHGSSIYTSSNALANAGSSLHDAPDRLLLTGQKPFTGQQLKALEPYNRSETIESMDDDPPLLMAASTDSESSLETITHEAYQEKFSEIKPLQHEFNALKESLYEAAQSRLDAISDNTSTPALTLHPDPSTGGIHAQSDIFQNTASVAFSQRSIDLAKESTQHQKSFLTSFRILDEQFDELNASFQWVAESADKFGSLDALDKQDSYYELTVSIPKQLNDLQKLVKETRSLDTSIKYVSLSSLKLDFDSRVRLQPYKPSSLESVLNGFKDNRIFPPVEISSDKTVVNGYHRVLAALLVGFSHIPVKIV